MHSLMLIGIIIAAIIGVSILVCIRVLWLFIKEHGIEMIFLRLMVGRHTGHHHRQRNTNATFWRDSDGKTYGKITSRVTKRHHRAGWKNLIRSAGYVFGTAALIYGLFVNRLLSIILFGVFLLYVIIRKIVKTYIRARNWYRTRNTIAPLAAAMSTIADLEDADMEKAITVNPDYLKIERGQVGEIQFPDSFHANDAQKEVTEKLVESRFPIPVELKWKTTRDPKDKKKTVVSAKIWTAPPLPTMVRFTDYLSEIGKCKPGEYIMGPARSQELIKLSHNGDKPMKAFSMDSGTGKTTMLGNVAAQLLGNDPTSGLTAFDVKRVSLEFLKGIPEVTIFSDPGSAGLMEMWKGWYALREEMDNRYALKQAGKQSVFPRRWIFLEEGNTFAMKMNGFYKNELRKPGEGQTPPIWYDCIAQLLWQGREVNMFVIAVLQNFIDKQFGGMSLRSAFGSFGMAGYKPNQWLNIVQTRPVPALQTGQGRICIVDAPRTEWVQGLYGTNAELREYAMKNRILVGS